MHELCSIDHKDILQSAGGDQRDPELWLWLGEKNALLSVSSPHSPWSGHHAYGTAWTFNSPLAVDKYFCRYIELSILQYCIQGF